MRKPCNYSGYNYSAVFNSDINTDSGFADIKYGNLHIRPDSQCIDAGKNSYILSGLPDIDNQSRVFGTAVDIGADESYGETYSEGPLAIVRVSPAGSDQNDGSTWQSAMRTVQAAVEKAYSLHGEVWVKSGVYNEHIELCLFGHIFGGFSGNETSKEDRNWQLNETVLDGGNTGGVIKVQTGGTPVTIDGFIIRNGTMWLDYEKKQCGGGIACFGSSPIITNCRIENCGYTSVLGGGIYCDRNSSPIITHNTISKNTSGLYCVGKNYTITNNIINENISTGSASGVVCGGSNFLLASNTIIGNKAQQSQYNVPGTAVSVSGKSGNVVNNLITNNDCGGICCGPPLINIAYNTVANNKFGLVLYWAKGTIANNIIAHNDCGIYDVPCTPNSITFASNCFYNNKTYSLYSIPDPIGSNGNSTIDPLFVNYTTGDYHLLPGSFCIDAANVSFTSDLDLDGNARSKDGNGDGISAPDIGCYEAPANYTTISGAKGISDGLKAGITDVIVTAVMPDRFYAETPDRVSGIGVLGSVLSAGKRVTIEGNMTTIDGERLISLPSVGDNGSATIPAPFLMTTNSIGGGQFGLQAGVSDLRFTTDELNTSTGLNNIGLFINVAGRVSYKDNECFYIDDSGLFGDGKEGAKGVKVLILPALDTIPAAGDFVIVTGISSCIRMYTTNDHFARLIRPVSVRIIDNKRNGS